MVFPSESPGFLPFQARGLASGAVLLLPRVKSVIDIAPDVPCSTEVVLACQELNNTGYRLQSLRPLHSTASSFVFRRGAALLRLPSL